jgi:protein SCO1
LLDGNVKEKEKLMTRKYLWLTAGILLVAVIALIAYESLKPQPFNGVVIDPAPKANDFSLIDQHGNSFELASEKGKVVLLFFGYTNCPDECPATLAKLRYITSTLGQSNSDLRVVMVTTDPERDTSAQLKDYLANFNPDFLGLLGPQEQLNQVYKSYGVTVLDGGETHSSRVYVIDRDGRLRLTFPSEMNPDDMTTDVKHLLQE